MFLLSRGFLRLMLLSICGVGVVFCDIDLNTFNLDVSKIAELITPSTKVIIPVHLFGLPANMELFSGIAKAHNLKVVEDAACGFGSQYRGRHVGLFGDTGCFSFHPRKSITTGEGGMITTENDELAKKLRCLRDHAQNYQICKDMVDRAHIFWRITQWLGITRE